MAQKVAVFRIRAAGHACTLFIWRHGAKKQGLARLGKTLLHQAQGGDGTAFGKIFPLKQRRQL